VACLGGKTLDPRRKSCSDVFEDEAIRGGQHQHGGTAGARLGRQGPDPGAELLGGQLLLQSAQANLPEVLHLFLSTEESANFTCSPSPYPQAGARKNNDLTSLRRAGSNTALFEFEQAHEAEADLSAFQDAARENPRVPGAEPHRERASRSARPTR
jgi:hypothetical protein